MELTLDFLRDGGGKRPKWRVYPPGWPCPSWIVDKVGVRRDWFTGVIVARQNLDGSVDCWPVGLGKSFWYLKPSDLEKIMYIYGKPTTWHCTYWSFL